MKKQIENFSNYWIYDNGSIWSDKSKKFLSFYNHNGYNKVDLRDDNGKKTHFFVHRLVALAFLDNPNNFSDVHHKNGIRSDNNVENLEWVSHKENILSKTKDRQKIINQVNKLIEKYGYDKTYELIKDL